MAKGVFIAEDMASQKISTLLRSVKQDTAIENGSIIKLGALVSGEIHEYVSEPIQANTDEIYFVDGVELISSQEITYGLDDFENLAKKSFRARKPFVNDTISISESMITAIGTNVVVGNVVETPATGNKIIEKTTATSGASFVGEIKARWNFGTRAIPMVRILVKKNL